jgi:hypothetical protein
MTTLKVSGFAPAVLRIPSYLLNDDEIRSLMSRLLEIDMETGGADHRSVDAMEDLETELIKRNGTITLKKE